jgi:hypothetical protein
MQKPMNRFYVPSIVSCCLALLLAACGAVEQLPAPPIATASPSPPSFVNEVTASTLPALVIAERDAAIEGNLPLLASLWAENGRIVDGRGSAADDDDYVWAGRAAILDRYRLAVFPTPPPPLTPPELDDAILTVEGDSATLLNGDDRWRFVLQDGRWWLQELIYSAPLKQ